MDKTLRRPLFQKKAMEAYKVKHGGKVPGYVLGQAVMTGIRTAAAPTFNFLGRQMARPSVRTALTGLEGYGLGVGANIAGEGYREGDTGKMIEGMSYALPAAAFLPATMKGSGIAALRETGEYLLPKATGLQKAIARNPGKTAISSIGGALTGASLQMPAGAIDVPEGMSDEQYYKDIQDRLIMSKPEFGERRDLTEEERKESPMIKRKLEVKKPPIPIGLENPQSKGEITLNKKLQQSSTINDIAEKLGVTDAAKATDAEIKQIAIESNVPEKELRSIIGREVETAVGQTPPGSNNPVATSENEASAYTGMTDVEIENAVKRRQKTLRNAKDFSSMSSGFKEFKTEIEKMTGTNNESLNNLISMKVAAKLLTGKSTAGGVAGFADIAGQAMGVGADSLLALKLAQQDQDMKLAQSFIKMKTEMAKKKSPGFVSGDKTYKIQDSRFPGGFYNAKGLEGKDGRQYYRTKDNQILPAGPGTVGNQTSQNADKINLYSANLEELKRGQDMITQVLEILPQDGTLKAAFSLTKEDAMGTVSQAFGLNGLEQGGSFDTEIISLLNKNTIDNDETKKKLIEEYQKSISDETLKERGKELYNKNKSGIFGRPTDAELERYSRLALIEQRMKYIVANANKSEDRLTQKDIENAAKRTEILKFFGSERNVYQNYKRLQEEFTAKAQADAMKYRNAGGTEDGMQYYIDTVPGVKEMYEAQFNKILAEQKASNKQSRDEVLNTIPIAGGS
tara:strand:- start:34 stop:2250 length:2217 start_codon:yes stop_codon:yes gene_type:complete